MIAKLAQLLDLMAGLFCRHVGQLDYTEKGLRLRCSKCRRVSSGWDLRDIRAPRLLQAGNTTVAPGTQWIRVRVMNVGTWPDDKKGGQTVTPAECGLGPDDDGDEDDDTKRTVH
jgi:hypothetical protein